MLSNVRSIGNQILSEKSNPGTTKFSHSMGTTMTIAEQVANLTPTATTYNPKFAVVKPRVSGGAWKHDEGGVLVDQRTLVGPGSYSLPSMIGPQFDSSRTNSNQPIKFSSSRTGRLPRSLEQIAEGPRSASGAPIPKPPKLQPIIYTA